MSKTVTKKPTARSRKSSAKKVAVTNKIEGFEPTKVSLAVSTLAVVTLMLFAVLATQ